MSKEREEQFSIELREFITQLSVKYPDGGIFAVAKLSKEKFCTLGIATSDVNDCAFMLFMAMCQDPLAAEAALRAVDYYRETRATGGKYNPNATTASR